MRNQLLVFLGFHSLLCKMVRRVSLILTSRIVLRLKSIQVHSGWSVCLISFLFQLCSWLEVDFRQVLEYVRHTSASGPLHLLVLWRGTLCSPILSWLFSPLLKFFVCVSFSVKPFLIILFNIVTPFPATTPTLPMLHPGLFPSIALITLRHTIFYGIFVYCLPPLTGM